MASFLRQQNVSKQKQDYVVVPPQRWLDGIATKPGVVRQFVATEMAPPKQDSSRLDARGKQASMPGDDSWAEQSREGEEPDAAIEGTIEWQFTGRDETGGLQLQIIPTYDVWNLSVSSHRNTTGVKRPIISHFTDITTNAAVAPIPKGVVHYDILRSPSELGLKAGDVLHFKNLKEAKKPRDKVLSDLLHEASKKLTSTDTVSLCAKYWVSQKYTLHVSVYKDSLKRRQKFEFEGDDAFQVALAIIRNSVEVGDGFLAAEVLGSNGLNGWEVVNSWKDLSDSHGRIVTDTSKPIEKDVFYVTHASNHHRYLVQVGEWEDSFAPLTFAIDRHATVGDLRRIKELCSTVERTTGSPIGAFSIRHDKSWDIPDSVKIFGELADGGHVSENPTFKLSPLPRRPVHKGGPKMQLRVVDRRECQDRTFAVQCPCSADGADLKWLIYDLTSIPVDRQRLSIPVDRQWPYVIGPKETEILSRSKLEAIGVHEGVVITLRSAGPPRCIFVTTLTGRTLIVYIPLSATVNDLCFLIRAKFGYKLVGKQLIFAGRSLNDARSLEECGIKEESTVHCQSPRTCGGTPAQIVIEFEGTRHTIKIDGKDRIFEAKIKAYLLFGVPACEQTWRLEGCRAPVGDDELASRFMSKTLIVTASTLVSARMLGLGAGGFIRQKIEPDTNDPRIWDVANSRILNVQLLDSRSFRAVTGLPPPDTPISAATYSSMGLPFYRLWGAEMDEMNAGRGRQGAGGWADASSSSIVGAVAAQRQKAYGGRKHMPGRCSPDSSVLEPSPGEEWGLLKTGAWGKKVLDRGGAQEYHAKGNWEESRSVASSSQAVERDIGFKIELLAVDDTVPEFKAVKDEEWLCRSQGLG
ncbi:hypothetical protein MAPG_10494 [Magnaporthiopsis poae ATCC 64411]|uniref:Ubiquitin-like domain-containing protein n=1 Tax=Magnaporthiopsis poae (strain ATCC 64411 / 73-15) TaxID=644358 RepID=A0A0C4ECR1_MAGP6|nr:hypothetical protein MAPG_10494 [Magnaporthiopsis poae ATCC 64411]